MDTTPATLLHLAYDPVTLQPRVLTIPTYAWELNDPNLLAHGMAAVTYPIASFHAQIQQQIALYGGPDAAWVASLVPGAKPYVPPTPFVQGAPGVSQSQGVPS